STAISIVCRAPCSAASISTRTERDALTQAAKPPKARLIGSTTQTRAIRRNRSDIVSLPPLTLADRRECHGGTGADTGFQPFCPREGSISEELRKSSTPNRESASARSEGWWGGSTRAGTKGGKSP